MIVLNAVRVGLLVWLGAEWCGVGEEDAVLSYDLFQHGRQERSDQVCTKNTTLFENIPAKSHNTGISSSFQIKKCKWKSLFFQRMESAGCQHKSLMDLMKNMN